MTEVREYFSSYNEKQMDFQITMGNRMKCTLIGRGTIDFQRESGVSTRTTDVLHMLGLGMNPISVSQLYDKVYDVHFIGKRLMMYAEDACL